MTCSTTEEYVMPRTYPTVRAMNGVHKIGECALYSRDNYVYELMKPK
jgi:hypothetical protein